jgi:prepilin signal peptidase PulO-like enzyme (type II secretory pathway)
MLVGVLMVLVLLVGCVGGATASLQCLVLERRAAGRTVRGRSACVCGSPIPLTRNIPVVSWIAQRGRAHCCGASIPRWYLHCEALSVGGTVGGLLAGGWVGAMLGLLAAAVLTSTLWSIRHRA